MQKAKWLSEEALQIAEKREVKGKGEKERYAHLNAELQRIARRDKTVINAKNLRKTIEWESLIFFKKIRDTRECFMQRWAQ